MAQARAADRASAPLYRTLSTPAVFLVRMLVFLVLVGMIGVILLRQVREAFLNNPGLNGLILGTLFIGILYAFRQVLRLYPEIRWVNAFRIADPGLAIAHTPQLLAPMAALLRDRTGQLSLSPSTMRSMLDSIGSRLDEARDTARYMVGLLVFLGLLGTFWGLLETIQSVGAAIDKLDSKATESSFVFEELKRGLKAPLDGMGKAFSASLLGLAGSPVLGFLDLQASQSHNRFYNELEEWLSGITEIVPSVGAAGPGGDQTARQIHYAVYEMQRSVAALTDRIAVTGPGGGQSEESLRELARGLDQLVGQMRKEQEVVRQWVDDQTQQQRSERAETMAVLKSINSLLLQNRG